jgi:hypothetical protein
MELKIIRIKSNTNFTEGKLYINGVYFCDTLEDKDRGLLQTMTMDTIKTIKVYKETCIPYGRYKVIVSMSQRFGKVMPELLNVKGFAGVRIHSGNTIYDTEGCILVGTKSSDGTITNSRKMFNSLMNILKTQKSISLIIE